MPYKLLSDDVKLTVGIFKEVTNDIKATFNELQKKGSKEYSIIGNSTSCVIAAMVANSDKKCKKLVLNLVGNDLAECMWYSENPLVKRIKNDLVREKITLNKLKNYFKIMSYKKNSRNLKEKEILIFLSKNDKIVPYNNGVKLLNLLNKDNLKYKLIINTLFGHYISYIKNLIFSDEIIKFLEKS